MNAKMEHITVTSTPSVTTLLDHLPVLVFQATREMACNAQVRESYVIILLKIAFMLMIAFQYTLSNLPGLSRSLPYSTLSYTFARNVCVFIVTFYRNDTNYKPVIPFIDRTTLKSSTRKLFFSKESSDRFFRNTKKAFDLLQIFERVLFTTILKNAK